MKKHDFCQNYSLAFFLKAFRGFAKIPINMFYESETPTHYFIGPLLIFLFSIKRLQRIWAGTRHAG